MEQSRYGKYRQKKTPEHRRSRFFPASFEDRNKYFRCWNCGFIVNYDKVSSSEKDGNEYLDPIRVSKSSVLSGDDMLTVASLDLVFDQIGVAMVAASDGSNAEVYSVSSVDTPRGCPFCGTNNLP
jgi:hypothetical protein